MTVLSDELARFIASRIPSVPYLEAVLHLKRAQGRPVRERELAAALYMTDEAIGPLLRVLAGGGLARHDDGPPPTWRYAPEDEALREQMERLERAHADHLVEVTRQIHAASRRHPLRIDAGSRPRRDR